MRWNAFTSLVLFPLVVTGSSDSEKATLNGVLPSYFISNSVHSKTGNRLVDDIEVLAFLESQDTRVLFTARGAYVGIVMEDPKGLGIHDREKTPIEKRSQHQRFCETGFSPPVRMVVMGVGFARQEAELRKPPNLVEKTDATVNFFKGPMENWQTGLPTFRKLVFEDVWPGIDLEYLGFRDRLEMRIVLHPGADPGDIMLETGAEELISGEEGLVGILGGARLVFGVPQAFDGDSRKKPLDVRYRPLDAGRFGFELGSFDSTQLLVIQPILTWSTFFGGPGGGGQEYGAAIAVDSSGHAFVTGHSPSGDYPTTSGAFDVSWNGGEYDVFVTKVSADGGSLVFSTYLGGSKNDTGRGVALDLMGNAIVAGFSSSDNFPTTPGAFDETNNGIYDVFLIKLSSDGSDLEYSTFLGGSDWEWGLSLGTDGLGNAIVTGKTWSDDFPTTVGALDESHNGGADVFVSKLNADGSELVFSTFLGGPSWETGFGLTVDGLGNIFVAGEATDGFPTTPGVFRETNDGSTDAFVSKLSGDGSTLIFSSFLGGSNRDEAYGIDVDGFGNAVVTGYAYSDDFPTTAGAYDETWNGGGQDVFVSKLSEDGSELIYSTYLGGNNGGEEGHAIVLDGSGNSYVTGFAGSNDFPTTPGAFSETGGRDLFVSKLSVDGSDLIYSTFVGGDGSEYGLGIEVDVAGCAFVAGFSWSSDYPSTPGAFKEIPQGGIDVFITKLNSSGTALAYSTLLGGTSGEGCGAIAVDPDGNPVIAGATGSNNFPTTLGAFSEEINETSSDVFVSKLTADGSDLVYSSFLGGSDRDSVISLAVDTGGDAYFMGETFSSDFPTTANAFDLTYNGSIDIFVGRLSSDGSSLVYGSFFGGESNDFGKDIALDADANVYLTGYVISSDFPTTSGAFSNLMSGDSEGFLAKFDMNSGALSYATFLGGSHQDRCHAVTTNSVGEAFVTGETFSVDFPTTPSAFDEIHNGEWDVFVSRFSDDGSGLVYSTLMGGPRSEGGLAIELDDFGNAFLAGYSRDDFPITPGAFDETYNGELDIFVGKLNTAGNDLTYSTFVGGSDNDVVEGIVVDELGRAYLAGYSDSSDFPTTLDAFDESHGGWNDAFLSLLGADGSSLHYSTYLGGIYEDKGFGVALNKPGATQVFVAGDTFSTEFPSTEGVFREYLNGYGDCFVTCFRISCLGRDLTEWPSMLSVSDFVLCLGP